MFNSPSTSYSFVTHPGRTTRSGSGDSTSNSSVPSNSDSTITVIEFGELAELPPSNEILKTLECPICKEIFQPPIFNCRNGHSICSTCRPKLANCALCKADYTEARNYSLESLILSSKFYCHYKDRNCPSIISGENYREHLKNCLYRPGAGAGHYRHGKFHVTSETKRSSALGSEEDEEDSEDNVSEVPDWSVEEFEVVSWAKCKNGQYPENDAVVAGYSAGTPVFIARAYQGSRLIMGRMIPNERAAYVFWHGCVKKWYYEILVAVPGTVKWIDASWGDVPLNAVSGGESPDMENVFVGRAVRNGQHVPGYVQPSCLGCYIGVGHQLYLCHNYQVLVLDT